MSKGMDVAIGRNQAQILDEQAARIKKISSRIDGLVGDLKASWWGDDSQRFAKSWEGQHKAAFTQAEKQLRTVADNARAQAKAQETTSS